MAKINIITNISNKQTERVGPPFCILDRERRCKIEHDKIVFDIEGEHLLQIGSQYLGTKEAGRIINYEGNISAEDEEEWYLYRVPFTLRGKGKLKKISKVRFIIASIIRRLVNNLIFLIIVAFVLLVISP